MKEMMNSQGGDGKGAFTQHAAYFPFSQEPTGTQELRSNLLTHVEETSWERGSQEELHLALALYKSDLGERKGEGGVAARANTRGDHRTRSKWFLKKGKVHRLLFSLL